ncbi:hypothetical protein [Riemerella columbina]|uniref:hypothetical protein n=1 Tax=Riemerella columbina TaxID=103810 RepID=UPI002670411F|nr:hypothetical protein [Riemerella columbina]WKS95026.1 hypothetical protein NYR17_08875 [Riemerella columbina]
MKNFLSTPQFSDYQSEIDQLVEQSPRFRRVFSEYCTFCEELAVLETTENTDLPDVFLEALKLQVACLKAEIEDWLHFST